MRYARRFGEWTLVVALGFGGGDVLRGAEPVALGEALVLESVGRAGRNTLFTDAVEASRIAGTWSPPKAGDVVVSVRDARSRVWTQGTANAEGWLTGREMRGGWAYFTAVVSEPTIQIFEAAGHAMAYVNGEPRAGDIYAHGYVSVPVALRAGTNEFLVAAGRGRLRVRLVPPPAPVFVQAADMTAPDVIVGEKLDGWAAAVVVNATTNWLRGATVRARLAGSDTETKVGDIAPSGVRKVAFRLRTSAPKGEGVLPLDLVVRPAEKGLEGGTPLRTELRIRRPDQTHKRTFVSGIDGSVQYYAVNPGGPFLEGERPALFLSFHGASVEAMGQAEAYGAKRWGTLVAPTNRRPYGFDWEEWGRLDALEVLDLAKARFRPDPSRIYLTGHSMGGHGTWNFGVTFPDRFAAIGPSAGWISFFSYAGTDALTQATPVEAMLRRAVASSDTLALATNFLHHGVYVVHGDADDNVPVREARTMREVLGRFHRDFDGHEQPGAGHWWGNSDEPGAECVDWPPMFDFFSRHRIPRDAEVRQLRFVTVNPGVNHRSHWLGIEAQERALLPSEITAQWDPGLRRVVASTRNVARVVFEAATFGESTNGFRVELDGKTFDAVSPKAAPRAIRGMVSRETAGGWVLPLAFERREGEWAIAGWSTPREKGPHRAGPFKDAFRHRMIFVYGTTGTAEERAWSLAKARFDAESFWYRGNGSVDLVADSAFAADRYADRGVILYGHADMNSAWKALLADSPVWVGRGEIRVGDRRVKREDAACLFLRPRADSDFASVGVVAGSGMPGLRLTDRLPYFMAGTGYPDCLVLGAEAMTQGNAGIVAAGFFGNDWSIARGEFAWKTE